MDKNNTDKWTERHFQICLALIARNGGGNMSNPNFADIINKADRMVNLLEEHDEKRHTEYENEQNNHLS